MMSAPFVLAHLVSTGVGPFYDGAAHFFLSMEEVLPAVVLSILGGLRGPRAGRWVLAVFPLAWVLGGAAGIMRPASAPPAMFGLALLMVPAVLVAWDRDLPLPVVVVLATAFGLWVGFANGAAMALAGAGFLAVVGAASSALVVTILAAAVAVSVHAGWPRIALRVAGSWIAALGLLALGWALKG